MQMGYNDILPLDNVLADDNCIKKEIKKAKDAYDALCGCANCAQKPQCQVQRDLHGSGF